MKKVRSAGNRLKVRRNDDVVAEDSLGGGSPSTADECNGEDRVGVLWIMGELEDADEGFAGEGGDGRRVGRSRLAVPSSREVQAGSEEVVYDEQKFRHGGRRQGGSERGEAPPLRAPAPRRCTAVGTQLGDCSDAVLSTRRLVRLSGGAAGWKESVPSSCSQGGRRRRVVVCSNKRSLTFSEGPGLSPTPHALFSQLSHTEWRQAGSGSCRIRLCR